MHAHRILLCSTATRTCHALTGPPRSSGWSPRVVLNRQLGARACRLKERGVQGGKELLQCCSVANTLAECVRSAQTTVITPNAGSFSVEYFHFYLQGSSSPFSKCQRDSRVSEREGDREEPVTHKQNFQLSQNKDRDVQGPGCMQLRADLPDKQNSLCSHNKILFSHEKQLGPYTCYSVGKALKTAGHRILHDRWLHLYRTYKQSIETQCRLAFCSCVREWGNRRHYMGGSLLG